MSFNYGREERKWRLWKEAEEKQLQAYDVLEILSSSSTLTIDQVFNSDRKYYLRLKDAGTYLEEFAEDAAQPEVKTVRIFLTASKISIYHVLIKGGQAYPANHCDEKMQGYSTHDIASLLGMTEQAIYKRVNRLKEKIKKILK